ncbi:MAG: hypothetical protein GJV46_02090 [Geobacter sp.]|nr:hypothetical protein [Geobacter sp.]
MIRLALILIATAIGLTGCVNPGISTIKDTKVAPTYIAPQTKPIPEQPKIDLDAYRSTGSARTYSLSLNNADLSDVLRLLSKESGVSIVAERGIRDTVTIEAQNKKLGDLLYTILKPRGYTASVENGVVIVGKPKLSTRTFRVNYLKDRRSSTSNMNVSGFSAGSVSVSTEGKSDFWAALEDSLELMVFGTSGKGKRESGGYIRGEDLTKVVSEIKSDASRRTGSTKNLDTPSNRSLSINSSSNTNDRAISQLVEHPESEALEKQLADNKLKQLLVNEIAGIIQVTDLPENLDKIAVFLTDVEEGSKRQVLIQAHIMEVNLRDSFSMGIDWKYIFDKTTNLTIAQALVPANPSNVFKIAAAGNDFSVLLDAMKEQGNVNMLSSPKITALNNQKAVIKLTTKQVSWVSTKTTQNNAIGGQDTYTTTPQIDEVGIFLDVTPQIGQDNSITMQIHPSVSEIKEISTSPDKTSTKPVIDIREIDTMVDAKAGETVVIAGLISDKLNETKRSLPFLGDIPYLGAIFSYNKQERTKTELVIMMTPYILNPKSINEIRADHEQRIRDIGGTFYLINNLGSMVTEKSSRDWIMNSEPHRIKDAVRDTALESQTQTPSPNALPMSSAPGSPASAPPEVNAATVAGPLELPKKETNSAQRLEQQQTEIKQLLRDIKAAKGQLTEERMKNDARAEEIKQLNEANMKTIVPEQAQAAATNMQAISATSDREQTIYRAAVMAYKTGNCAESIKSFDSFLMLYPNSPFAQDAAYYRKDCTERR